MIPPERFGFDEVPCFGLFLFKLLRPSWPIAAGRVCMCVCVGGRSEQMPSPALTPDVFGLINCAEKTNLGL